MCLLIRPSFFQALFEDFHLQYGRAFLRTHLPQVKTVQLTMSVKPTKKHQLQSSLDLNTWTNLGAAFTATTSEIVQEFNAIEVGRYFRLYEIQ